jgi:hypothetical protein
LTQTGFRQVFDTGLDRLHCIYFLELLCPQKLKIFNTYQSAGAPGIPLPGEGTITVFLSSVRHTHWSIKALSRSASASDLSANTRPKDHFHWDFFLHFNKF